MNKSRNLVESALKLLGIKSVCKIEDADKAECEAFEVSDAVCINGQFWIGLDIERPKLKRYDGRHGPWSVWTYHLDGNQDVPADWEHEMLCEHEAFLTAIRKVADSLLDDMFQMFIGSTVCDHCGSIIEDSEIGDGLFIKHNVPGTRRQCLPGRLRDENDHTSNARL